MIITKSYDGNIWEWEEVPEVDGIPEELLIQVLGSRRPVLFVEGENGSYDVALFRILYPDHLVVPRGSCHQVIQSTKSLRNAAQLHYLNAAGIVDRDRRSEEEINVLQKDGICVLELAEVENLFCVPEILELLARQLSLNCEEVIESAKGFVCSEFEKELDVQVSLHTAQIVSCQLNNFDNRLRGVQALIDGLASVVDQINIARSYAVIENDFKKLIAEGDYVGILKYYNRKKLASRLGAILGLKDNELPSLVIRLANGEREDEIVSVLKKYLSLPALPLYPPAELAKRADAV